jgi:hypothetical protein
MMETILIIALIAFMAGMALSRPRPSREPQIIYIQREVETGTGGGCLLPLVLIALAAFVLVSVLVHVGLNSHVV